MEIALKVHHKLVEKGKLLLIAESCTGGKISVALTSIPDASRYLLGALITYSDESKRDFLLVKEDTLHAHGAVSREVATEMLIGLFKQSQADYAIAVTGIAGPSGGTREKPVGTVFIAVGERGKHPQVTAHALKGSRAEITDKACDLALEELLRLL